MDPRSPERRPDGLAARLFAQPATPDVRANQCLEKIRQALEEHDCQLIVSLHLINGGVSPEITVVPTAPPAPPAPSK